MRRRAQRFPARGGPPTVIARMGSRSAAPVTLLLTHVQTPWPSEDPLAQLERFAGEVVPAVRRSRTDV